MHGPTNPKDIRKYLWNCSDIFARTVASYNNPQIIYVLAVLFAFNESPGSYQTDR
jgi:hypothetical protein